MHNNYYSACGFVSIWAETAFHNEIFEGANIGISVAKNTSFEISIDVNILSLIFSNVEKKR